MNTLLFFYLCLPVAVSAQSSVKALPSGHYSFGIGTFSETQHIIGGIEFALTDSSKAIIKIRIPWREENILGYKQTHFPALQWVRITPLPSRFESFVTVGINDIEFRDYDTISIQSVGASGRNLGTTLQFAQKSRNVSFLTGIGILKRIEYEGLALKPYLGLSFYTSWETSSEEVTTIGVVNENEFTGHLRGILGLETELSSSFIVRGGVEFPLGNADTMFHVGFNYNL